MRHVSEVFKSRLEHPDRRSLGSFHHFTKLTMDCESSLERFFLRPQSYWSCSWKLMGHVSEVFKSRLEHPDRRSLDSFHHFPILLRDCESNLERFFLRPQSYWSSSWKLMRHVPEVFQETRIGHAETLYTTRNAHRTERIDNCHARSCQHRFLSHLTDLRNLWDMSQKFLNLAWSTQIGAPLVHFTILRN